MASYSQINERWGTFVEAKINLPQILQKERKHPGRVVLGSVCDPYQPVEAYFRLSRQVLEILGPAGFEVEILTKSDLVLRDIDLLERFSNYRVEITITTLNEEVREFFEPGAPSTARRLVAVKRLTEKGVNTTVFFGPVLPYFSDSTKEIEKILLTVASTGAQRVLIDKLNYIDQKLPPIRNWLKSSYPRALAAFEMALREPQIYTIELRARAISVLNRLGLAGGVIF